MMAWAGNGGGLARSVLIACFTAWIFGEEYNLWASDKDLTTVLKAHRDKLDSELVIDDPVRVVNKTRGIVDLMLSRAQRRHRHKVTRWRSRRTGASTGWTGCAGIFGSSRTNTTRRLRRASRTDRTRSAA
jgi:hypothetical protein